jgi:hypothetical protein
LPGAAHDVGIGADGSVWVIGNDEQPGGFGIWRWNGSDWDGIDGAAVRIAVGPDGQPWVVNASGDIFQRAGGAWLPRPGAAQDIGVGANGAVWVIGTNEVPGGFGIWQWNGTDWVAIDGGGVRISVGPDGQPWIVNANEQISCRIGNGWQLIPDGAARDIAVGSDPRVDGGPGSVWVAGTNPTSGGYGIWRWNLNSWNWKTIDGGATNVAVDSLGLPWVVNDRGEIFRRLDGGQVGVD